MSDLSIVTIVCIPPIILSLWMIYEDAKYDYEESQRNRISEEDLQETILIPTPEVQESDHPWWLDLEAMNEAVLDDNEATSAPEEDYHFKSRKVFYQKKKNATYFSRISKIYDRIVYKETESE